MPTQVSLRMQLGSAAGPAAAASGDTTIFTVPEGQQYVVTLLTVVGNGSSKVTAKWGLGGTADANLLFPSVAVPGKGQIVSDAVRYFFENDTLVFNASATGLTYTVDGYAILPHL